ncbi:hypothetical protein [Streptomyces sp. NPDC006879]|uniref:hypothetical protein n=1 Tax=Streptomyces sp. NPDC006879 TaxID=3364767 RepID=UPI0036ADA3EF
MSDAGARSLPRVAGPAAAKSVSRRKSSAGGARENQWSGAAARRYVAAQPIPLVKDVPLYTL